MNENVVPPVCLQGVEVRYGKIRALADASFTIDSGAVGLLGPNGAGKTTLLKTLLGFIRADRGRVEMFGMGMPASRRRVRGRLGYMPEGSITSPKISAVSFLRYCGCLFGMAPADAMERAHEVLNWVGVGENRYRKMATYSTGMRQRVKFAQALIHDPKLLLLDEPTNGLDPKGRIEMLGLIQELVAKRKVTVLLSSHLMPDVAQVCDRVIVLSKGKVVRDGRVSELTALQESLYEVRVRENKEGFLKALAEAGCKSSENQSGIVLVHSPRGFAVRSFFEIARTLQTQVRHLQPVRQSLEEAFIEAVEGARVHDGKESLREADFPTGRQAGGG